MGQSSCLGAFAGVSIEDIDGWKWANVEETLTRARCSSDDIALGLLTFVAGVT